jgi:hypothetical protein
MNLSPQKFVFSVCVLFLLAVSAVAQSSVVTQIRITSSWGGLGTPAHNELIIVRKGNSYHADDKIVDAHLINNLFDALHRPAVSKINLNNLGIIQTWLDANAETGVREYADFYYSNAAPNLQALYLSTFKNLSFITRLVPSLYESRWTDDYPLVEVEVTKADGTTVVATSEAQQLFMLPWVVSKGRLKIKTYDARIARAVVALLPNLFANRERLSGESLNYVLAEATMREIQDKWDLLDAQNKAGKYLQTLQHDFLVESAEINSYHNVDFGKEWVKGDPGVENLQAILARRNWPRNFRIGIALPFANGEVEGVDTFLRSADRYVNLTLAVPWLNEYIRSHPRIPFELRFVGDRSFSEKAMQIFAADMKLKRKESLAREIEAAQKEVSLLAIGWVWGREYWLVLPDKKIVVWRFRESSIKWTSLQASAWECSNYYSKCSGAIISRNGSLEKPPPSAP